MSRSFREIGIDDAGEGAVERALWLTVELADNIEADSEFAHDEEVFPRRFMPIEAQLVRESASRRYAEMCADIRKTGPHGDLQRVPGNSKPAGYSFKQRLRRYFDPREVRRAEALVAHSNPVVADRAQAWLAEREAVLGRFCANPACLEPLTTDSRSGRGRKRWFCDNGNRCKNAAKSRDYRNERNPNRAERFGDERFQAVIIGYRGFAGNGKYRRKSWPMWGLESVIPPDIRMRVRNDLAIGNFSRASRLIEHAINPDWTDDHRRALEGKR